MRRPGVRRSRRETARPTWEQLQGSTEGLSAQEAASRLARDGPNVVPTHLGVSWPRLLLTQFTNPLVLLLIGAALVSIVLGERAEAGVILAIVLVNALLGFYQEHHAERALAELSKWVRATSRVRRGGAVSTIPAEELVVGDVVLLTLGDIVPADVKLVAVGGLSVDEAALTGESVPVDKASGAHGVDDGATLRDHVYLGTTVTSGRGEGVIVATGARTLMGKTAAGLHAARPETDFQTGIRRFSTGLLIVVLVLSTLLFAANSLLGRGVFDSLLFALALAVGVAPEALPVVITLALSRGALRLARERVVVRRLISIEDLGNVDILCCDKTGTLTTGEATLARAEDLEGVESEGVLFAALACATVPDAHGAVAGGSALDMALWRGAEERRLLERMRAIPVLSRNELDFERRRASVVADLPEGRRLVVKGAPESVLAVSTKVRMREGTHAMGEPERARVKERVAILEAEGFRVLAVASRDVTATQTCREDERDLCFDGFLLLVDPPKPEAADALRTLAQLRVGVKMLTGDSATVARRACAQVGLVIPGDRIVTGEELESLDDASLQHLALECGAFARVSPDQKRRIVAALASSGHVVGFLGDGVNDAPAIRAADVGISVDTGAAVAKEAADIVLLCKGLDVLAHGIIEGRRTFANITKYVLNTISANFGNMSTVAVSSLFLPFIPLLPAQILLNNLLSDVPLLTVSTDRVDPELLERPRRWDLPLIGRFMILFGLVSAFFDLALLVALTRLMPVSVEVLRTAWFVESACSEILVTFAIRTRERFYRSRPSGWLLGFSAVALAVAGFLPFTKLGHEWFEFVPLDASVMGVVAAVLAGYFLAAEMAKRAFFRRLGA